MRRVRYSMAPASQIHARAGSLRASFPAAGLRCDRRSSALVVSQPVTKPSPHGIPPGAWSGLRRRAASTAAAPRTDASASTSRRGAWHSAFAGSSLSAEHRRDSGSSARRSPSSRSTSWMEMRRGMPNRRRPSSLVPMSWSSGVTPRWRTRSPRCTGALPLASALCLSGRVARRACSWRCGPILPAGMRAGSVARLSRE